jgi:hypothetical protein
MGKFVVFFGDKQKEVNTDTVQKPLLPAVTPARPTVPTPPVAGDEWEIKIETVKDCSKCPTEYTLEIEPLAKVKIKALLNKYRSLEWLAYLVGENNRVKDLLIPEQCVSGARVDDVHFPNDHPDAKRVIGVIHSHHSMGNFFSGTDDSYINQNHDISLVATHDKVTGKVRYKLPCGAFKDIEIKILDVYNVDFNEEEFVKAAGEKIKEKTYSYHSHYRGADYVGESWYERYGHRYEEFKKKEAASISSRGGNGDGSGFDRDEWDCFINRSISEDDREETLEQALFAHFKKVEVKDAEIVNENTPKPDDPSTQEDDPDYNGGFLGSIY